MAVRNLFVNRATGAIARIDGIDASFVILNIIAPSSSKYSMPVKEYDSTFIKVWRPATEADLDALDNVQTFRYPHNAPSDWTT